MKYIKRFLNDILKYKSYMIVAAKAYLKSDVTGSHLSWLWWILDPLLFMLIYSFVSVIVFNRSQEYLVSFIFIGLACWNFYSHVLRISVTMISKYKGIISRVYVPKFVLIIIEMLIWGFKMMISYMLVFASMILYRIRPTHRILYAVPLFFALFIFTFSCSMILMHFGVFFQDLANVTNAVLRLIFYLSGVFYSIDRLGEPYRSFLMYFNPIALVMDGLRACMLFGEKPNFDVLLPWLGIGLILSVVGIVLVYKNENVYVKIS